MTGSLERAILIEIVSRILNRCANADTNICPTILYNEGWITRLLVETSIDAGINLRGIDFSKIRQWYSEGLLSTPFRAERRGDKLAEGYTHADMALGDFHVDSANRGDIKVDRSGSIFGVIEAKMGSPLSAGTKNAPNYDQASRNLACIAYNTLSTKHSIFFVVAAPQLKIEEYEIDGKVNVSAMITTIASRFDMYDRGSKVHAKKDAVLERARTCSCLVLSYESWIDSLTGHELHSALSEFKDQCYWFNRIG